MIVSADHNETIERAFSRQSMHYDEADAANLILQEWRKQVYHHVESMLKPGNSILELNAGTGIDAVYFAGKGYYVHATDQSSGMINRINEKIQRHNLSGVLTCEQRSYELLKADNQFDMIFSNFGGLNCVKELRAVTQHFTKLLKPGGLVSLVIMPPVCPWEWGLLLKGQPSRAFRRFRKNGAISNLEGERFLTYYHSRRMIDKALGRRFKLLKSESLGLLSPPPHRSDIPTNSPRLYNFLSRLDLGIGKWFPFNRWGDHVISTYQFPW